MRTLVRLCLLSLLPLCTLAEPVSVDDWFRGPRIQDVAISGDGRYLSIIVVDGDSAYVAVKDRTAGGAVKPVFATDPKQSIQPRHCVWVGVRRLVCRVTGLTKRKGLGEYVSRLVALDADGGNQIVLLTTGVANNLGLGSVSTDGLNVLAWWTDEPDTILVSGYFPDTDGYAVEKVNADTGRQRVIVKPMPPISLFQDDGRGNVVFGVGFPMSVAREQKMQFFGRTSNDQDWKQLTRLASHAGDSNVGLLTAIPGEHAAYALLTRDKHRALFKVDLTDQRDPEPVFWHEERDVDKPIVGTRTDLLGVAFESSALGPQYLDKRAASVDAALKASFPNRWNWIESVTDDQKAYVIRTTSASEAPNWFVLDTSQGGAKFEAIGSSWPGFVKAKLPATQVVGIRTRTGVMREGLFTPHAVAADKPKAPLVVFADGAQQTGGFEPATYFLVSRGYAVLRTYFTGTTLDAEWHHQPFLDWNGRLYDELVDVAQWAAQQPGVDADRICVIGRNAYGGYQGLLAASRTDNPFKCAASLGGLSDLVKARKNAIKGFKIGEFTPGGPPDEQIVKESPLRRAAEVHMPVLIVENDIGKHDAGDTASGREIAAALAAANKPHKLLLIADDEDPYLRTEYDEVARFLEANLR